jgi:hypothetical protein
MIVQDRVLIRTSNDLELFLAAIPVIHDFVMQQTRQIQQGQKADKGLTITVELGHEEQFFFSSLFPRMDIVLRGQRRVSRSGWECVLDFRNADRALSLAMAQKKHLTETWGIICGASPPRVGELGAMAAKLNGSGNGIFIDSRLLCGSELADCLERRYPGVAVKMVNTDGWRACRIFDFLGKAGMFIGYRSAATYMVAMMQMKVKKKLLEIAKDDFPSWFLDKNACSDYCSFNSGEISLDVLTLMCSELIEGGEWITSDMNSRGDRLVDYNQSTAVPAAVR